MSAQTRWQDHVRQRTGETNEEYWHRQKEFAEREAIRIEGWCEGARAMLDAPAESPRSEWRTFWDAGKYQRRFMGLLIATGILAVLIIIASRFGQ